jgi:hypothetical protein
MASAQPLTFTSDNYASFAGARAIVSGDFDRNGWSDVAQANTGRNTVTVLLNHDGALTRGADIPVGAGPFDMAAGDFNRDGVLDLAVAVADANVVSILMGKGDGTFTKTADLASNNVLNPRGVIAADVNGDGKLDVVLTGYKSDAVQPWLGDGAGTFTRATGWNGYAAQPQGLAAADFNHDGRVDIVAAYDSAGGLAILYGNGGVNGFDAPRGVGGAQFLNVVATGDFNRDGWIDVASASTRDGRVAIFLGSGAGLTFNRSYATGSSPRDIACVDLDHDGVLDIVTANYGSNTVSILLGSRSAPGTFSGAIEVAANQGSRALVSGDFDHDGRIDLVTANQSVALTTVLSNRTIFTRSAYTFSKRSIGTATSSWSSGNDVWPVDFNHDGKLDVATSGVPFNTVQVLITGGETVTLKPSTYVAGWTVGDFNHDGNADILMADDYPTTTIFVMLGDGRGGFSTPRQTSTPYRLWLFETGELNGDASPDLVWFGYDPAIASHVIVTMTGNGDGTFRQAAKFAIDTFVQVFAVDDLDRDGKQDVLAQLWPDGLQVWKGNGAGGLTAGQRQTLDLSNINASMKVADLNHDGYPDVVATSDGTVGVLLGGAGGLGAPSYTPLVNEGGGNGKVALADLNTDGHLDIVVDQGVIMFGHGDGTFTKELFDFDGNGVRVADFNDDGLPDVIVGLSDGEVGIISNQRNAVNHPPTVSAGEDATFNYQQQFEDYAPSLFATAHDPDVHALTYEWRDETGTVVGTSPYFELYPSRPPGSYTFSVTVQDGRGASATDSIVVTIAPTKEIVLYAADWGGTFGKWTVVADATAADGQRVYDPNRNAPKVTAPSPDPASLLQIPFIADPTQTYKLWIRLKADGNAFSNDSVWVQFTGSTDAAGNAVFRSGTSSGLAVNLEECSGCGLSGWGWEDDGWGAVNKNGVALRFPEGGWQRLIIQTREDGVSIDQIVLSAETYLTRRPGTAKNDATILKRTLFPSVD